MRVCVRMCVVLCVYVCVCVCVCVCVWCWGACVSSSRCCPGVSCSRCCPGVSCFKPGAHVCRAAGARAAAGAGAGAGAGAAGAGAGAGAGATGAKAGAGPSPLITVNPRTKLYFRQSRATLEPQNKNIFNDTGTTPEEKKHYLPGIILKRYGNRWQIYIRMTI